MNMWNSIKPNAMHYFMNFNNKPNINDKSFLFHLMTSQNEI